LRGQTETYQGQSGGKTMKKSSLIPWNLQLFAEDGDTQPTEQKVKIGEQEYTIEELQERLKSYEKLEKQFTKVSQEKAELQKIAEQSKEWLEFDKFLQQFPDDVRKQFGATVENFFRAVETGNVTQRQITNINKAIEKAEAIGNEKLADTLTDARDEVLSDLMYEKEISSIEKQARKDGIEFDEDEFEDYLANYLEEEELLDENGQFDLREIKRAYKLYLKDKLLEKQKKEDVPNVGTGSTGVGVGGKNKDAPKSIREAFRRLTS
jgi:hypothetical protein